MAVRSQKINNIQEARLRRIELPHYLRIEGSRYLLGMIALLCLMSLIVLAQTGVVATRGYAIAQLQNERTLLLRERAQIQLQLSQAQSLEQIRERAGELGLRPWTPEQVRYLTIVDEEPWPQDTTAARESTETLIGNDGP